MQTESDSRKHSVCRIDHPIDTNRPEVNCHWLTCRRGSRCSMLACVFCGLGLSMAGDILARSGRLGRYRLQVIIPPDRFQDASMFRIRPSNLHYRLTTPWPHEQRRSNIVSVTKWIRMLRFSLLRIRTLLLLLALPRSAEQPTDDCLYSFTCITLSPHFDHTLTI